MRRQRMNVETVLTKLQEALRAKREQAWDGTLFVHVKDGEAVLVEERPAHARVKRKPV